VRRHIRENALPAAGAAIAVALVAWLGLTSFLWSDYETESLPAFRALVHGHLLRFLSAAPIFGGSLLERAPFALAAHALGGGELALYQAVSVPCLLAAALLGVILAARMRARGLGTRLSRGLLIALLAANPLALLAFDAGHGEEILAGALVLAALLAALERRALLAGALLGLAIANKEWAVVIVPVVAIALARSDAAPKSAQPARLRSRALSAWYPSALCCALAALIAALALAPFALASSGFLARAGANVSSSTPQIFQPWQLFWLLGSHYPGGGERRLAPALLSSLSHPLVLLCAPLLALLYLWRANSAPARTAKGPRALLALAALTLLLRCLLDTWDTSYYLLPFIFVLGAWELCGQERRPPALATLAALLGWASFVWVPESGSGDLISLFFLAWTLPLGGYLALEIFAPASLRSRRPRRAGSDPIRERPTSDRLKARSARGAAW
jgi:hypothetical protein